MLKARTVSALGTWCRLTLRRYPPFGTETGQQDVGGDFENHNHQEQDGLSIVELVLGDADIFEQCPGEGVACISAIQLDTH